MKNEKHAAKSLDAGIMRYDALGASAELHTVTTKPLFFIPTPSKNLLIDVPNPFSDVIIDNMDLVIKTYGLENRDPLIGKSIYYNSLMLSNILMTNVHTVLSGGILDILKPYCRDYIMMQNILDRDSVFNGESFSLSMAKELDRVIDNIKVDSFNTLNMFIADVILYSTSTITDWCFKFINNILISGALDMENLTKYCLTESFGDEKFDPASDYAFVSCCLVEQAKEDINKISELAEIAGICVFNNFIKDLNSIEKNAGILAMKAECIDFANSKQ